MENIINTVGYSKSPRCLGYRYLAYPLLIHGQCRPARQPDSPGTATGTDTDRGLHGPAHHRLHHSVTISEAQNYGTSTRSGTGYSLRMFHLRRHRCRSALRSQTRFPMQHSLSVRSCIRSADGKPANNTRQRVIRHSRKSGNPGIGLASTCLFDYLTTSLSFPRRRESRRRQHERKPWIPACAGMTVQ